MADNRPSASSATIVYRQQSGGILGNADHTVIYGGNFTNVVRKKKVVRKDGFERLQERVAASAFHNSRTRSDPPRCHEHTREAVLEEIFDWITRDEGRTAWIAWLNGAAGAGKTAICQSVAEICITRGILVASFFFFRTDGTRNSLDYLVATLAYQFIQLLPEAKTLVTRAIETNPLIFEQTFEAQLDALIVQPLLTLSLATTMLLIVDGVDECNGHASQIGLIRTVARLLSSKNLSVIVLFASRNENQITMAFNAKEVEGILLPLRLDDNYFPHHDIRVFLRDRFNEVKATHPFKQRLDQNWPAPAHLREIVNKSSGQFIYASVVINFVSDPMSNPAAQLEIVRGLRPTGRSTPFAQLDALYCHIFSQVNDLPTVLDLLAYIIFVKPLSLKWPLHFLQLTEDDAQSILASLTPILVCNLEKDAITFLHASLPDFLLDQTRSQEYCIRTAPTRLAIMWFNNAAQGQFQDLAVAQQNLAVVEFLRRAEAIPSLLSAIRAYTPAQNKSAYWYSDFARDLLSNIRRLDFGDGGAIYRYQLYLTVRFVKTEYPTRVTYIAEKHDVAVILHDMDREAAEEIERCLVTQSAEGASTCDVEHEGSEDGRTVSLTSLPCIEEPEPAPEAQPVIIPPTPSVCLGDIPTLHPNRRQNHDQSMMTRRKLPGWNRLADWYRKLIRPMRS